MRGTCDQPVSLLVAPVALARFDEMVREDLASGEIDDNSEVSGHAAYRTFGVLAT
jgi:hypothetical protein